MEMTKSEFDEFKRRYRKAVKEGKDSFIIHREKVLVSYAKYVIEFMQPKFNYK